jgi:quercetin dioxygenase-like cupin family protein
VSTLAASLPAGPYAPWPAAPDAAALLPRLIAAGAPAGAAGARLRALGVALTPKVTADQTNNAYAIFEAELPPGAGVPAQRGRDDLVLYVLEGELVLAVDWREHRAPAGACAFVPRGTPHAYRNAGRRPARALLVHAPGAARADLYAALDAWGRGGGPGGGPPDVRVLPAIFGAFGAELLPAGGA